MSSSVNQPLKYPGGQSYLARRLVDLFPRHLNYVEPYCGGCSVLLARDPFDERFFWPDTASSLHKLHRGVNEVVNDLNLDLMRFWSTLQDAAMFKAFCRLAQATPFSEPDFVHALAYLNETGFMNADAEAITGIKGDTAETVLRAYAYFVVARQSRAGNGKNFTPITKTRLRSGMNNEVSAWLNCVDGLPEVHDRLKRVLVLNRPALKLIDGWDTPETFFFLDPPWVHSERVSKNDYGRYEMSDTQHVELLSRLVSCKASWLLLGRPSKLYESFFKDFAHRHVDFLTPNQASGAREKGTMTVRVWMNY